METKGPTLEEVARIFDGDDAVAHVDITEVEKNVHGDRSYIEDVEHRTGYGKDEL